MKIYTKAENGHVLVAVPKEMENMPLEVVVNVRLDKEDPSNWANLPAKERLEILKRYAGSAKFPDTPIDKYDVYEQ